MSIDPGFLDVLLALPPSEQPALSDSERNAMEEVSCTYTNELVFLVRKGDLQATRALLRCLVHHSAFGGCECTRASVLGWVFDDGPTAPFWIALAELPSSSQAEVIRAVDPSVGHDVEFWWNDLDKHLNAHQEVRAIVGELHPELTSEDESK